MQKHSIKVEKTGHYYSSGNPKGNKLLLALHGYGQLAKYFIQKLSDVGDNFHVIAPQGLNQFYTDGYEGRVGASWMTSENRDEEIEDYLNYLNKVVLSVVEGRAIEDIWILGFSQGSATATRLFCNAKFETSGLILWSGMPAHDIEENVLVELLKDKSLLLLQGDKDNWRPEGKYLEVKNKYQSLGIEFREEWFDGGHEINSEIFRKLNL